MIRKVMYFSVEMFKDNRRMKPLFLSFFFCLIGVMRLQAQFTRADTLRGALRPERTCYDVYFYDLELEVDIENKSIKGSNTIYYNTKIGFNLLQIDLFENMEIDKIVHKGKVLEYNRKYNAVFVNFGQMQEAKTQGEFKVFFHGTPITAQNPPWNGGFVWKEDKNGKPFVATVCEGIGASLWWPNKDHLSDEPDSMRIRCTVPKDLMCVSNGNMRRKSTKGKQQVEYEWFVSYPINNYNVTLNIAHYVHFSDTFLSPTDGSKLPMDYYVLPYNLQKARKQFKQSHKILDVFERYFGKYPFWNDGYALVETPYLGMEHQSAIAYGNEYMTGYKGRHPKGVPVDYIILHETGHEWWGNSISCRDHGEMWLHEAFTTYMEAIYVEAVYGYADAIRYVKYHMAYVANRHPLLGPLNVNYDQPDVDIYYKGSAMLHTLRRAINEDKIWWDLLKSFYQEHALGLVGTEQFIDYVNEKTGEDYAYFFDQYLRTSDLPVLWVRIKKKKRFTLLKYKWGKAVDNFKLPVYLKNWEGAWLPLKPEYGRWKRKKLNKVASEKLEFDFGLFELQQVE